MRTQQRTRMTIFSAVAALILFGGVMLLALSVPPALGRPVAGGKIISERTIIAPGTGAEGIMLGENISEVTRRFGKSRFRISRPARPAELFTHVFKVAGPAKIFFDVIYHNDGRKCAVCVSKGSVVAVIGLDSGRTTTDDVSLQSGAENFIFNYGNRGLRVLTSGNSTVYLYQQNGIAVVDDDTDDTIDLYLVFTPSGGAPDSRNATTPQPGVVRGPNIK